MRPCAASSYNGPGEITVEQVPDARLAGPDGAVLTMEHTAICGSDLHLYHDALTGTGVRLGHEFIGLVKKSALVRYHQTPVIESWSPG